MVSTLQPSPSNQVPVQSPPVTSSSAPSALVPEHVRPARCTGSAVVVTAVSGTTVAAVPSTRTLTVAGAASVGGGAASAIAATIPASAPDADVFIWEPTPFREGLEWRRSEEGLLAPGTTFRAFPPRAAEQWLDAVGIPGHSGGSAPDSHRLP
jgi:hypothetical protein